MAKSEREKEELMNKFMVVKRQCEVPLVVKSCTWFDPQLTYVHGCTTYMKTCGKILLVSSKNIPCSFSKRLGYSGGIVTSGTIFLKLFPEPLRAPPAEEGLSPVLHPPDVLHGLNQRPAQRLWQQQSQKTSEGGMTSDEQQRKVLRDQLGEVKGNLGNRRKIMVAYHLCW